jgi:collagen type VII alpha
VAVVFLSDGAGGSALTPTSAAATVFDVLGSGSVVAQTTVKEHGYGSFKHDSGASNLSAYVVATCLADAGRRISIRFRFDNIPTGSATGIIRLLTVANAQVAEVRLNSAGKLVLYAGATGSTLQATGTTTISAGTTWRRIAVCYTITNASTSEWRVYLDGTLELTASNPASQVTASNRLRVGWTGTGPGANAVMYSQDYYVDDSTALTDPGDVRVTGKMPASISGTTNAWTLVGSAANRWDAVDERPASTANRYTQTANAQVTEQFLVQADAVGDDDLTGATILGEVGWAHYAVAAAAGSTLISMYLQGNLFTLTTTAGSGVYQTHFKVATSAHASADLIGLRSSGTTADSNFAEAGILIAYIAAAPGETGTVTAGSATGTGTTATGTAGGTATVTVGAATGTGTSTIGRQAADGIVSSGVATGTGTTVGGTANQAGIVSSGIGTGTGNAVAGSAGALGTVRTADLNQLPDPSFELPEISSPWDSAGPANDATITAVLNLNATHARRGAQAAHIAITATDFPANPIYEWAQDVAITPNSLDGQTIWLNGWFYRTGTEFWNYLSVQFYDGVTLLGSETVIAPGSPADQWNYHQLSATVPVDTDRIRARVLLQVWSGHSGVTGDVWWDGMALSTGGPTTGGIAEGSPVTGTAVASSTGTVTVGVATGTGNAVVGSTDATGTVAVGVATGTGTATPGTAGGTGSVSPGVATGTGTATAGSAGGTGTVAAGSAAGTGTTVTGTGGAADTGIISSGVATGTGSTVGGAGGALGTVNVGSSVSTGTSLTGHSGATGTVSTGIATGTGTTVGGTGAASGVGVVLSGSAIGTGNAVGGSATAAAIVAVGAATGTGTAQTGQAGATAFITVGAAIAAGATGIIGTDGTVTVVPRIRASITLNRLRGSARLLTDASGSTAELAHQIRGTFVEDGYG